MHFADGAEAVLEKEACFTDPAEAAAFWSATAAEVDTEDGTYPGADGESRRYRLYRGGDAASPTLLYLHGGGWVGGSIELHDYSARGLAVRARCNVVSIAYRLAPVHRYPAALEDCLAASTWIEREGRARALNPDCVVIGGASAGGNLAAAAALRSPRGRYAGLLIFYGVLGADFETPSYQRYANGPGLTRARMQELFSLYLSNPEQAREPAVAPLLATTLETLPATQIIAAEHDVLLDDNRAFAEALQHAGVPVSLYVEPGVTHGYINRGRLLPSADHSIARAAEFLVDLSRPEASV